MQELVLAVLADLAAWLARLERRTEQVATYDELLCRLAGVPAAVARSHAVWALNFKAVARSRSGCAQP